MFSVILFTTLICVATCQFGALPYNPYNYNPYVRQPYPYYGSYYRAPAPIPSPYRFGQQSPPPPQPLPSPYTHTSTSMGTLPLSMYDNFVCHKIAGRTRKRRDASYEDLTLQAGYLAYQKLFGFTKQEDHHQLWDETRTLARFGYSTERIIKTIIYQRMRRDGENGNINDIYNAINYLNTQSTSIVQETQKRAGMTVCQTTNAFYCSYIRKLIASAPYCSGGVLSNQLYQQCCTQYSTSAPTPVPSPYSAPTTTTNTGTNTGITSNTTTTCGVSNVNPAPRMEEFSSSMNQMRIVGGVTAERCEYPWMTRLRMGSAMCGGSIIDAYHIMTAAHCVGSNTPSTISVHTGEYDYNIANEQYDQTIPAQAIIKHPNYRDLPNGEQENDIAIIKLARPIQFNECVKPICLAKAGDGQKLAPGTQCTTAGWGTTSSGGQASHILQETTIPTYNGYDCGNFFSLTKPSNAAIQLCAGRPVIGGADTCQGDSGGPLFCPVNGRYVQYGVVSYGAGCADQGAAGVYTDVGRMRDFIDNVVNNSYGK